MKENQVLAFLPRTICLSGMLLVFLLCFFMPKNASYAQTLLHDKRLKSEKQEKKEKRKKLFKAKNHEKVKKTDVEVRTSSPGGQVKDRRKLQKSKIKESTQNFDFKEKESTRPYRPEMDYRGNQSKRSKNNPSKKEGDFSGEQKLASTIQKPQRGVTSKGEKGKSKKSIEKNFRDRSMEEQQYFGDMKGSTTPGKGSSGATFQGNYSGKSPRIKEKNFKSLSQQRQQYTGEMKYSSTIVKKGRVGANYSGRVEKGVSRKSKQKDFRALSIEMHQNSGNIKVVKDRQGKQADFAGNLSIPTLSAKTRHFKRLSKDRQQYTGNLKFSSNIVKKGRVGANYSGNLAKGRSQKSKDKDFRAHSLEMHQYTGNIKVVKDKQGKYSNFAGNIKVPSLSVRTKHFTRLSKKMHQYEGNIKIKKSNKENLHPSVAYLEGKNKSSYQKKEKLRNRKISRFRLFKRNSDQPKSVKEKPVKPKYDSRESEIWYD